MSRIIIEGDRFLRNFEEVDPDLESVSWTVEETCPICRGADGLTQLAMLWGTESPSIGTALCQRCLHCFQNRRPDETWLGEYYTRRWDARGRRRAADNLGAGVGDPKVLDFCHGHIREGARVLDVGCGFGEKLLPFRQYGCEVTGVELSRHRAEYCRERLGIDCREIGAETMVDHFRGEKFDLVFSNHVLEHVSDPRRFLRNVLGVLAEGGLMYVAVPNLLAAFLPWVFHFAPHVSSFSSHSLQRLLLREGLAPIRQSEDRELQVLVQAASHERSLSEIDGDVKQEFRARLSEQIVHTFYRPDAPEGEPESTLLVFSKAKGDPAKIFHHELLPARASTAAARLMFRVAGRSTSFERVSRSSLLHWWFGRYPGFRYFNFRMDAEIAEPSLRRQGSLDLSEFDLPIELAYPHNRCAPFWIK